MTRLICSRCRYECRTELQRTICPRCASIIDTPAELHRETELLELERNQEVAYVEQDLDLSSALGLAAVGAVLEPDRSPDLSPSLSPDLSPDLWDEVLDLPESSPPVHSYNSAFAEVDSDEDEVVFEEPAPVMTSVAPNQNTSPNPPRVIRLSEPKVVSADPEPLYYVPNQRLGILQGRSWRVPAIVAAISVAAFGLYALLGRTSPSTHPATAARKTSSTPAPGPSHAASTALSPSPSKASSAPAVKATVRPAAKIPVSTPSPVPVKSRKPAEELAKADKRPVAEPKRNGRHAVPIPKDCKHTVQVGSFPSEQEAKERAGYLKSVGVVAQVVKSDLGKRGVYFRVMSGRFLKQVDARRYGQQLLSKGKVQEFVVARQ